MERQAIDELTQVMDSFNGTAGMGMESNLLSGHHQVQESNDTVTPPPSHDLIQMENPPDHQSVLLPPSEDEMEAKRLKRILASRQYSQKYRYKQLQNTLDLQRQLKSLEANINAVQPKIKQADHSILMLGMENTSMKLQISTHTDELLSKEAECEKLRMERDMLKQLHLTYHPEQQQDRLLPTPMEITQVPSHVNSFNFSDIHYNINNIHITNSNTSSSSSNSTYTVPNNLNYFENFTTPSQNNNNTTN